MYKRKILIGVAFALLIAGCGYAKQTVWNVFDYGAKGDGTTVDTEAIQSAIDACNQKGGGVVCLEGGRFVSGTLVLKSHVRLHIESGAVLSGSTSAGDYREIRSESATFAKNYNGGKALLFGENATDIAVTGTGLIDGRGDVLRSDNIVMAHIIHFKNCERIKVQDVTLYNGSWWIQKYTDCRNLTIDGVTVDSRENKDLDKPRYADAPGRNTDGCNIVDCRDVRISNCHITSGDDGIVLKSFSRDKGCRRVAIMNCLVSTNASGIKIGTETAGNFEDILVNNCVVYDTRLGGIELMTVDGSDMDGVIVSNITLNNIKGSALFIRLADRGRPYDNPGRPAVGRLRNVLIQNVYGKGIEKYGCSITGLPAAPLESIVLQNINLSFTGGNEPLYFEGYPNKPVPQLTVENVPEEEKAYPRCDMFGKLPAYGLYIRHAREVELSGIRFSFEQEDKRPALVADDVSGLTVSRFRGQGSPEAASLIHFRNVKQGLIQESGCEAKIPVFLQVSGGQTGRIRLGVNWLDKETQPFKMDRSLSRSLVETN